MLSRMVNIGVIGLGFMGLTHIKSYRHLPQARITAICDAIRLPADGNLASVAGNISQADEVHFDMSVVKGYRDYREMLANPSVDMVDICLPTPLHAEVAIAALQAGKHVLCEKPLARNSAVARTIVEAAARAKGYFMPAMCLRFWPEWAWLKQAIDEGRYGRLQGVRFTRFSEPPGWSQASYFKGDESGGALLDMHIHDSDFVQFCFGRPRSVYATGRSQFSGAIDHVTTIYQVASGASVVAEGSWLMTKGYGFKMAYVAMFEKATVDYDCNRGGEALKLFEKDQPPQVLTLGGSDGYVGELRHFLESIESGRPPTLVTGADGMAAVEICEAEEQSIKTGSVVPL